jgi:hypothetical protein
MKLELMANNLDGDWWFYIGIGVQRTDLNPTYKWVFDIGFGLFTLYIRW